MSKKIWLIRHGESIANAGAATLNHETIPLSPKGWEQAENISLLFKEPPTLIITSPFTRTKQTAEPTVRRFPTVKQEVWDVQEFTYLAPHTCVNTTADDRKERVNEYWNRLDPDYVDGEGAENFTMLLARAKAAIDRLKQLEDGFILLFTHGQFMRAMHMLQANSGEDAKALMKQFRDLPRFENCQVVEWKEESEQ